MGLSGMREMSNVTADKRKAVIAAMPRRVSAREKGDAILLDVKFLPQEAEYPFRFLRWILGQLG
jgi:hypothetical protein